jgi:hypothetical protein
MLLKERSCIALFHHFDVLMRTLKISLKHTAFQMPRFLLMLEDYSITQESTVPIYFVADT